MKKGNFRSSDLMEREITLLIRSENPQEVVRQISSLESIADLQLQAQGPITIQDTYFDTSSHILLSRSLALRTRRMGSTSLITLKGPSQEAEWGGLERLEIEEPWSEDALHRVMKELADRNVKLPRPARDLDFEHPFDALTGWGLEVIQDRDTERRIRNIIKKIPKDETIVAELAVDTVVYHISGTEVLHYEVEIEAKIKEEIKALKILTEGLFDMYGQELQRWPHSKLATGKAIERLLLEGDLVGLLDRKSNLKTAAYDRIEDFLKRESDFGK